MTLLPKAASEGDCTDPAQTTLGCVSVGVERIGDSTEHTHTQRNEVAFPLIFFRLLSSSFPSFRGIVIPLN